MAEPLSPIERTTLAGVAMATAVFGAYGALAGEPSTLAYLAVIGAVGIVVARLRTSPLPDVLVVSLGALAVAHLAGGLVRVGDDVLYNVSPGTSLLRYDHLVHSSAVLLGTLALREVFGRRTPLALLWLGGLGLGAVNETVEFLATLAHHGLHIGGYTNTGWDLVSNVVGATAALVVLARRSAPAPELVG
ncbi:MAG TPA: hypothetical protein VFJ85_11185 [Acidimicrobiales bacterium]|nr:hypothetical protein [Acidimicrobiales bacterium]